MADQTSSRLLDQARDAIRLKHYSIRTEEADVDWIKRFILFHKTPEGSVRHPQDMGAAEIAAFLTHLGCRQKCCCFDPESSSQCLALLISQRVGARRHLVRRRPARQKAQTPAHGADQRRDAPRAQPDDRHAPTDGPPALRQRPAPDGVRPFARQGYRFRPAHDRRPRRQR